MLTRRQEVMAVVSTHSRPKAAALADWYANYLRGFQHTAARRRLLQAPGGRTHRRRFNTQPPEGGCESASLWQKV